MTNKITKLMLDGEEYLIREYQEGWKPGANTIAYYPLNSTTQLADMSGNNYNLTSSATPSWDNISFVNTSRGASLYNTSLPALSDYTVCFWYKSEVISSDNVSYSYAIRTYNSSSGGQYLQHVYSSSTTENINQYVASNNTSSNKSILAQNGTSRDSWNLYILTKQGGTYTISLNGTLLTTQSAYDDKKSIQLRIGGGYTGNIFRGYISNFILEDKVRTGQEITDYYNQTKSLYGIN